MNDFELVRRVMRGSAPDPGARERARARLEDAIRAERARARRRRRPLRPLLVAAGVAGLLVLLAVYSIGPFRSGSAAAAELRRLSEVAASSAPLELGEAEFILGHSQDYGSEGHIDLATGKSYNLTTRLDITTWVASSGDVFQRIEVLASRFASEADRATWEELGTLEIPKRGDVYLDRYPPDEAPWMNLSLLPPDPSKLLQVLRDGSVIPVASGDENVFELIGEILVQGNASPELRAALFEVAARLGGVELIGPTADPLGRQGVALAVDGPERRVQLVFDPETAHLLALETYPIGPDGTIGAIESWRAPDPAVIVDAGPKG